MQIGTSNNIERTGDRDLSFSNLMRKPRNIRVCDTDPSPRCTCCKRLIALFEAKRMTRPENDWIMAHTEYTRIDAALLDVEAYFLCTSDDWKNLVVIRLGDFKERPFTESSFISWLEEKGCSRCKGEKI